MNVPRLRFPAFSDEWAHEKLGNICGFSQGIQVDLELQINEAKEGYVKFLRIENYTQNSFDFRFIPIELSSNKYITSKEIVVVRYGATAGYISRGFDGVLANNLFRIHPETKILDNDFLFEYLKREQVFKYFQTVMFGGAMPALSFSIVRSLELHYPRQLPEQTKIANFLTAIDEKITQFTQKCDLLAQYKKGVMQQIFSQKLRFKDDDGREFPEWEETALGDIAHIKTGSKDLIDKEDEGIYPFFVRAQKIERINSYSYDGEAILIPGDGVNVGKVYHYVNGRFDYHQRVYKISDYKNAEAKYIFFYMNQYFDKHAMSFNSKASVDSLRLPIIQKFKIQLPTKLEQTKIANFLTAIDDKITQAQTQLEAVKRYKKGLLQQLFV